jgi:hypothetical protein
MPPEQTQTEPEKEKTEDVTTETETTLEDVAKKYNVEEQVSKFTAQPQQPEIVKPPETTTFPDPVINPDEWNTYQANLSQRNQQLEGSLRDLTQQVSEIKQQATQTKLDAEVNKAVAQVNQTLEVDPVYAEILLEKRYRDDPIFKSIWDKRTMNPKALGEALNVIAKQASKVFQTQTDPQLAENLRAAKSRTKATTQESNESDEMMQLSDAEFDQKWEQMKRG